MVFLVVVMSSALARTQQDAASIGSVLRAQGAALTAGQAHVDALITFLRERTALEDAHARALQRLAKTTLSFDGARCCTE